MSHKSNHHLDHQLAHRVTELYKETELFGPGVTAKELSDIVKQHAAAATGAALIPVPGLDIAAMIANTWTMYARINKAVGVSFGDNVMKSIASGVIGNVVSVLPAAALGMAASTLLKFVPGIGTVGGIAIGAATNVAILFVAGKVYIKSLEFLANQGKPLTPEALKEAASEVAKNKTFVNQAFAEGKAAAKGT